MFAGVTYYSSQVVLDTMAGSNGCDSISMLNVVVTPISRDTIVASGCDSAIIGGTTYFTSQVIMDTLTGVNGCDSIIMTNLTITPIVRDTNVVSGCDSAATYKISITNN